MIQNSNCNVTATSHDQHNHNTIYEQNHETEREHKHQATEANNPMHIVSTSASTNCIISKMDNPDRTSPPREFISKYKFLYLFS